jgi:hypothetical protein
VVPFFPYECHAKSITTGIVHGTCTARYEDPDEKCFKDTV